MRLRRFAAAALLALSASVVIPVAAAVFSAQSQVSTASFAVGTAYASAASSCHGLSTKPVNDNGVTISPQKACTSAYGRGQDVQSGSSTAAESDICGSY